MSVAVWWADGSLRVPPRMITTFDGTVNSAFEGVKLIDKDGNSDFNIGDSIILDKTICAAGTTVRMYLDWGEWAFLVSFKDGTKSYSDSGYEQLPPPPMHINMAWVAAQASGAVCVAILYMLASGRISKEPRVITSFLALGSLMVILFILITIIVHNTDDWILLI
jgi:hypothetical protein